MSFLSDKADAVKEYCNLARNLEIAMRCYIWANDYCPGDNLGQSAKADAIVEIRRALRNLDILRGVDTDVEALVKDQYGDNPNWKRGP